MFDGFILKPDLLAGGAGTRDPVLNVFTYSKLSVQLVRVVDEVAELLSCQRPAG